MGHKYEWIEEPWILRVDYFDRFTRDDFEEVMEYCLPLVEKHPATFLVDITQITDFDINIVRSTQGVKFATHPNTLWLAVIGIEGPILKLGMATLGRFFTLKQFKDSDDALAFLREIVEHHKREGTALTEDKTTS